MTTNIVNTRGRGWAYIGVLVGGGISIAANIAHSFVPPPGAPTDWAPQPGAVIGSMFWPILLFVAVEILVRVAWPQGFWYALLRLGGLLPVAGVAALVSFRHLSGLLAFYGEDAVVSFWGPLAIDGLMVMATAALLVTGRGAPSAQPAAMPSTNPVVSGHAEHSPATTHREHLPAPAPTPVPAHLIQPARFAVTNHQYTHGRPISSDELAAAINTTPAMAGQLLATLDNRVPVAPVLNGTPIGGAR